MSSSGLQADLQCTCFLADFKQIHKAHAFKRIHNAHVIKRIHNTHVIKQTSSGFEMHKFSTDSQCTYLQADFVHNDKLSSFHQVHVTIQGSIFPSRLLSDIRDSQLYLFQSQEKSRPCLSFASVIFRNSQPQFSGSIYHVICLS